MRHVLVRQKVGVPEERGPLEQLEKRMVRETEGGGGGGRDRRRGIYVGWRRRDIKLTQI